ncbi:MAG: hypothetical protein HRF45_10530 [Fimbriimonadia bacterium]
MSCFDNLSMTVLVFADRLNMRAKSLTQHEVTYSWVHLRMACCKRRLSLTT